jgi:hypothetical protein
MVSYNNREHHIDFKTLACWMTQQKGSELNSRTLGVPPLQGMNLMTMVAMTVSTTTAQ